MSFLNQNMNEVIDVHNFVFHTGWTFFLSFCQFEGIKAPCSPVNTLGLKNITPDFFAYNPLNQFWPAYSSFKKIV